MSFRYWGSAAAAMARHVRSTPGFARDLLSAGLSQDHLPAAPTRFILDAYPECEGMPVELGTTAYRRSNLDPMEQYVLAVLTRLRAPRRVLEIGTFDGATTLLLARNAPGAEVLTLDLPPDGAELATVDKEVLNASVGVGSRFRGRPEQDRVQQLLGDSMSFDFSPWYGTIDLILVDGGHESGCVKSDTENAYRLIAPGGMIIWDDYQVGWPGVVKAVDESPGDLYKHLIHVAGTDFALYDRQRQPRRG